MRSFALIASLLLFVSPLWAPHADAQTVFHYTSEAGDYIGQGRERTITPAGGYTFGVDGSSNLNSVSFSIDSDNSSSGNYQFYGVEFAAPAGTNLTVGDYPGATRYPFQEAGAPGLNFDANGSGSNMLTGQFQVLEISFNADGTLAKFAANFAQHSEGAVPASYGEIRYNSSLPYLTPAGVGQIAASTYSLLESAGTLTVTATRRDGSTGPLSVNYTTADGTDLAGRDYTATTGAISWADGDTANKTFTIPILNSGNPLQGDGTFLVNLSGLGTGAQTQAVMTVVNDNSSVTFVHFVSDKGDFIGGGQERTFSIANGYLLTASQNNGGVSFSFNNEASVDFQDSEFWDLEFAAATGTIFGVGDYENAQRAAFKSAGHPGLEFSGDGRGSNTLTGDFQVLEAQFDNDGNVLKFAANFDQHSEGGVRALRGQVRYNSTVPLPTTVSVVAEPALIVANTGTTGAFVISRTGDTSAPLTVYYSVSGSAVGGRDYQGFKGAKVLKAGKASARVQLRPLGAGPAAGTTLTVKLKLQAQDGGGYTVSGVNTSKVTLLPTGSRVGGPSVADLQEPR